MKTESFALRAQAARAILSTDFWRLDMNWAASWGFRVTGGGLGLGLGVPRVTVALDALGVCRKLPSGRAGVGTLASVVGLGRLGS